MGIGGLARKPWHLAAAVLLLALFAGNIYRAATQSISHDEAVTYQWFLSGPFSQVFGAENGNHHPLSVLLCKVTVSLFGLSEFSMRIPSLLGGLLYFYAIFQICAFLFGEGPLFFLAVAFLSLNPFLLDYLCCARGYSVALGFFLYGVDEVIRYLSDGNGAARRLHLAGVAVGLSIGSNVIMIFPAFALMAVVLGIIFAKGKITRPEPAAAASASKPRKNKKERKRRLRPAGQAARAGVPQMMLHLVAPALAVAVVIVTLPRRLLQLEVNYYGPPSLLAILEGLVRPSLLHSPGHPGLAGWLGRPDSVVRAVTDFVVPAGFFVLAVVTVKILIAWMRRRSLEALPLIDRFLLLLGGMLPMTLLMIVASRYIFQVPYPEMRTVLYWFPLLGLACLSIVKKLAGGARAERLCAAPLVALLTYCVVQFATQFNTRYFAEWTYDAATRDMIDVLRTQHARKPDRKVRVGATWQLEPGINFYRAMYGLDWIAPVHRESPDGDYDYYFLLFDDRALVERRGLKPLFRDSLSGAVLARAGQS